MNLKKCLQTYFNIVMGKNIFQHIETHTTILEIAIFEVILIQKEQNINKNGSENHKSSVWLRFRN